MNPLKTFFYSLKRSLFEPKYYLDVAKASFGFSFKYLWFLLFLLTIIKIFTFGGQYLKTRPQIKPGVNKLLLYAENFYPKELKLEIKKGQLSTNVREPYVFDLEENKFQSDQKHLLIIDTQGSIENYPSYDSYILATRNAVVYPSKSNNNRVGETSVFYFRNLKKDFIIDKKSYDNVLNIARPYVPKVTLFFDYVVLAFSPLCMIFGSFFWTIGVMFGLLFTIFFVWIINLVFKKGFSYGSLYKMGMHAVTLPILVSEISKYLKSPYPTYYSWVLFIWMMVIIFSQKKSSAKKRA